MNRLTARSGSGLVLSAALIWLVAGMSAACQGTPLRTNSAKQEAIERCPDAPLPKGFDPSSKASLEAVWKDAPLLFRALGADRRSVFKELLARGENPNICVLGGSLLSQTVFFGDLEGLRLLLDAGANTERPLNSDGSSVLATALSEGNMAAANLLLARGADARHVSDGGSTALHALASRLPPPDIEPAQAAMVTTLLQRGVSIDAALAVPRTTALMYAAVFGNQPLVEQLLRLGADPKLVNSRGETALSLARKQGHAGIVALLAAATP